MSVLEISLEKNACTKQNLETKNQILLNIQVILQSLTLRRLHIENLY